MKTNHPKTINTPPACALLLLILFSALLPGALPVKAQETTGQTVSLSPGLAVTAIELSYETRLTQLLSGFFNPGLFYVEARLITEESTEKHVFTAPHILYKEKINPLLPGLPYLPQEYLNEDTHARQIENPQQYQNLSKTISLKNISVDIYADTSLNAKDLETMRYLAETALRADSDRGDIITISQKALPAAASQARENRVMMEDLKEYISAQAFKTRIMLWSGLVLSLLAVSLIIRLKPAD